MKTIFDISRFLLGDKKETLEPVLENLKTCEITENHFVIRVTENGNFALRALDILLNRGWTIELNDPIGESRIYILKKP